MTPNSRSVVLNPIITMHGLKK